MNNTNTPQMDNATSTWEATNFSHEKAEMTIHANRPEYKCKDFILNNGDNSQYLEVTVYEHKGKTGISANIMSKGGKWRVRRYDWLTYNEALELFNEQLEKYGYA